MPPIKGIENEAGAGAAPVQLYGVYAARVINAQDPEGLGRVMIELPRAGAGGVSSQAWARLATLMAGNNEGSWFIPDVGAEVLVAFEGGVPEQPYVVGSLWSTQNRPPAAVDPKGMNSLKVLRSRSGLKMTLDDTKGSERMVLETPGGAKITLQDGPGAITIEDANGNAVKLDGSGITVTAAAKVSVAASAVEVVGGTVTVNAGMAKFSGVVQADTVICNSVVAASYSPGAGNIW